MKTKKSNLSKIKVKTQNQRIQKNLAEKQDYRNVKALPGKYASDSHNMK